MEIFGKRNPKKTIFMEPLIIKRNELLEQREALTKITRAPTKGIYASITKKIEEIEVKIESLRKQNMPQSKRPTEKEDEVFIPKRTSSNTNLTSHDDCSSCTYTIRIEDLPTVVLVEALSYLKPYEPIVGAANTCHSLLAAVSDQTLWNGYLYAAMLVAKSNIKSLNIDTMKAECLEVIIIKTLFCEIIVVC
jgi:hypothetical protein